MKEKNWEDCINYKSVRNISPDIKRAKSLIETSKERIDIIGKVTTKNCNFVFEDYYTSIMEMLQAISFKEGNNVCNHVCLGFYLRDVIKRNDLYQIFDDLRYKRNSLTYYGNKMEYDIALEAIDKCKRIVKELKFLIDF